MEKAYRCKSCDREVIQDSSKPVPVCCGHPMEEVSLESCRDAGPEAARLNNDDEACEDFTGKQ